MKTLSILASLIATVFSAFAQAAPQQGAGMPGLPSGLLLGDIKGKVGFMAAAMSEFFSDSRDFTATASVISSGRDPVPIAIASSQGRFRFQLMPGGDDPFGIGEAAVVLEEGKPGLILIPTMKAYVEVPTEELKGMTSDAQEKVSGLKKRLIGPEKVAAWNCQKYLIESDDESDKGRQALVWNAKELNELPVKFMIKDKDASISGIQLGRVTMKKPSDKLFEAPEGWTKHDNVQSLMQVVVLKQMESLLQNPALQ